MILLLGSRYGTIDSEEHIGYTGKEYKYAKSLGKPIYVFEMNKTPFQYNENSKKLDAIQRDLDTYDFLKEDLYKIFMHVRTFFQHTPFDVSYIGDIGNCLLNYENNPHKSFIKINIHDYENFLKHLKNILILIRQGEKSLAHLDHFKLSFYKEYDRCLKAYKLFI